MGKARINLNLGKVIAGTEPKQHHRKLKTLLVEKNQLYADILAENHLEQLKAAKDVFLEQSFAEFKRINKLSNEEASSRWMDFIMLRDNPNARRGL